MKKILIFSLLLICFNSFGQVNKSMALKIGDKVPDVTVTTFQQGKFNTYSLKESYQKGGLILNFWATWCLGCVKEHPRLNELVKNNQEKLNMLAISSENRNKVGGYLEKNDLQYLEFISDDKFFKKLFPHTIIPHNVWIDRNGIVTAITDDDEINQQSISSFLRGQATKMEQKNEDLSFNYWLPLNTNKMEMLKRSTFTKYNPRILNGGSIAPTFKKDSTRYFAWHRPKTEILWAAFFHNGSINLRDYNLVELHTKDTSGYKFPGYITLPNYRVVYKDHFNKWKTQHLYSYELMFTSKIDSATFYRAMARDVMDFFNVDVKVENRPTECWVIRLDKKQKPPKKSLQPIQEKFRFSGKTAAGKNISINELTQSVNRTFEYELPFVDDAKLEYRIDIEFDITENSIRREKLIEYLNNNGFNVKKEKHQYPHLIVRDRK